MAPACAGSANVEACGDEARRDRTSHGPSQDGRGRMSDPHLQALPLPPAADLDGDAPVITPFDPRCDQASGATGAPAVEPLNTFLPRLERVARVHTSTAKTLLAAGALPMRVSHRRFQTALDV